MNDLSESWTITPGEIDRLLGRERTAGFHWRQRVGLVRIPGSTVKKPLYMRSIVLPLIDAELAKREMPATDLDAAVRTALENYVIDAGEY